MRKAAPLCPALPKLQPLSWSPCSYLRGGHRGGGSGDGAGEGRAVELWEGRRALVCQEAGGERGAAHSAEHSPAVGNGVLVTGVDPCKGRAWLESHAPLQGLQAAGGLQGSVSKREDGTNAGEA